MSRNIITMMIIVITSFIMTGCNDAKINNIKSDENNKIVTNHETGTSESSTKVSDDDLPSKIIEKSKYFEIKKGKLIRYKGGFSNSAVVKLPSEVKSIGKEAFALTKKEKSIPIGRLQTIYLKIPKDVRLDKFAFTGIGPMNLSFEDGRKKIEDFAFQDAAENNTESTIRIPDSVKVLGKHSFYHSINGSYLVVYMGNGVERLEEGALAGGIDIDKLPSSLKYMGKESLNGCGALPGGGLPESLEVIESQAISELSDGKIQIPSKVKRIAPGAVSWLEDASDIGYSVSKDNRYFKSDKNGWLYSKDGKELFFAVLRTGEEGTSKSYENKVPSSVKIVHKKGLVYDPDGNGKASIKAIKDH